MSFGGAAVLRSLRNDRRRRRQRAEERRELDRSEDFNAEQFALLVVVCEKNILYDSLSSFRLPFRRRMSAVSSTPSSCALRAISKPVTALLAGTLVCSTRQR
jgi:hypothetical protein